MSLREYIEDRSMPIPFVGCWLWLQSLGSHGYGQASMPGARVTTAHRVSYIAFVGSIPDGMLVQHSCDNKWCVNPEHLSLGTDKTNSDDKHKKGRANLESRVFANVVRKLTQEQIAEIRRSKEPQRKLANRYGVSQRSVWNARRFRTYRFYVSL
jgi:DNA-binding transcriptional regulator YiaG